MEYLYRAFDSEGTLLYIGISNDWSKRLHQHEKTSAWVETTDVVTIQRFPDRDSVEAAERKAIEIEKPIYNKVFSENYEPALAHYGAIKLAFYGKADPPKQHLAVVMEMRAVAEEYGLKLSKIKPAGCVYLYLTAVEVLAGNSFWNCRNCAAVYNMSTLWAHFEKGKRFIEKGGK